MTTSAQRIGDIVLELERISLSFGGVKALIDRAGATGFARLTGAWPGDS